MSKVPSSRNHVLILSVFHIPRLFQKLRAHIHSSYLKHTMAFILLVNSGNNHFRLQCQF